MKIRTLWLIRPIALLMAVIFRIWISTLCGRVHDPRKLLPPPLKSEQHYIYAFWHEHLLMPMWLVGQGNVHVLVSEHRDGQWIAEMIQILLYSTIRGSSTRGGVKAVRQMQRVSRRNHIGYTPDGPKGPRRQIQTGMIYTASRTGLGIVPMGFAAQGLRMNSWDRFLLPYPNGKTRAVIGEPIFIPPNLSREELEHYRQMVQEALDRVNDQAEEWLATGQMPLDVDPENVARPAA